MSLRNGAWMAGVAVAVSVLHGCGSTATLPEAREPSTPPVTAPAAGTGTPAPAPARVAPVLDADAQKSYQAALAAMQSNQDTNAETALTAVVKAQPKFVEARTNLGIVLFRLGRYARAEEEFKRVIADDPNNTVAYNYLGIVYRINGQFPQSKAMYTQALSINPNYANAQLNLGILYDLYLRDWPKALESYQNYQKMLPQEDKEVAKWIADLKRRIETGK